MGPDRGQEQLEGSHLQARFIVLATLVTSNIKQNVAHVINDSFSLP